MKKLAIAILVFVFLISLSKAEYLANPYPENNSYVPGGTINFSVIANQSVNLSSLKLFLIAQDAYEKNEPWQNFSMSCSAFNASHYICYKEILFSIVGSDTVEYFYFEGYDLNNQKINLANETHPLLFTLDRNPPVIDFIKPLNNSYVNASVNISVSVYDESSGLNESSVYIRINNGSWKKMNANDVFYYLADFSGFENNESVNLTVKATDLVGNEGNETIRVFVDKEYPSIEISKPEEASIFGLVRFEIKVSDVYSGIDLGSAKLYVSGLSQYMVCETQAQIICYTYFDTTLLKDGNYSFKFVIRDLAGNENSTVRIYEIKNSQPLIQILNENNYVSKDVEIKVLLNDPSQTLSDPKLRITNYTYDTGLLNMNYDQQNNYWYYYWKVSDLADGKYNVSVTSTDLQGRSFVDWREFYVDRVKPSISAVVPEYASNQTLISVIVDDEVRVSTNITLIFENFQVNPNCNLQLNNKRAVCNYKLDVSSLSNGLQSMRVVAYDKAGNKAEKDFEFIVDKEKPTLDYLLIVPSYSEVAENINFYVYASDNISGVASILLTTSLLGNAKSYEMRNFGNYWLATALLSDIGNYVVSITISDKAGNVNTYKNVGKVFIGPLSCGNGVCEENENYCNCKQDCYFECDYGNIDCGYGVPKCLSGYCGDGICMQYELETCRADCYFFVKGEVQTGQVEEERNESGSVPINLYNFLTDNFAIIALATIGVVALTSVMFFAKGSVSLRDFEEFFAEIKSSLLNLQPGAKLADEVRALVVMFEQLKKKSLADYYKLGMTVSQAQEFEAKLKKTDFYALEQRKIRIIESLQSRLKQLLLEKDQKTISRELMIIKEEWKGLEEIINEQKKILAKVK